MRTDVKVGIVIAAGLAILAGVWCVVGYDREEAPKVDDLAAGMPQHPDEGDTNVVLPLVEYTDPAPAPGDIEPGYRDEAAVADTTPEADLADDDTGSPIVTDVRLPGADTSDITLPPVVDAGEPRPYVVRTGDSFWAIAEREYGNAALHRLLEKANPNVPPRRLRPGMTILIPATPAEPVRAAPSGAAPGTVEEDLGTGKRFYVVKAGDRGFWGIAKATYGHGKHYKLIEAANPDLNPRRLKPGQKVWVPEKPEAPIVLAAETTAGLGAEEPRLGAPVGLVKVRTGAPTVTVLPDGRVFD